jgi:hypothetical protein
VHRREAASACRETIGPIDGRLLQSPATPASVACLFGAGEFGASELEPAIVRTPSESGNIRVRSAEGIYKTKRRPGFDSESPTTTALFAYICTYLRVFALKTSALLALAVGIWYPHAIRRGFDGYE